MAFKKIFKSWRVLLLLFFVVAAVFTIYPRFSVQGVIVRSVSLNSAASEAGILAPDASVPPSARERILSVNGNLVNTVAQYHDSVANFLPNQTVHIKTDRTLYRLTTKPLILDSNETTNGTKAMQEVVGTEDLGIKVSSVPRTNIRKGLDLAGGSRVLLQPAEPITEGQLKQAVVGLQERLNVFGLSDISVRGVKDLSGEQFVQIEIAEFTEEEIASIVTEQGKFEAKIGNVTAFTGSKEDVSYVCLNDASCSGLSINRGGCQLTGSEWVCPFFFQVTLSDSAAKNLAEATKNLSVVAENGQNYLERDLDMYLDDVLVSSLKIGSELKGREVTDVQISGSESGPSESAAQENALAELGRLQVILSTGSLPVKMNVVKIDTVSPLLGQEFLDNALFMGLLAFLSVALVVFVVYRKLKIVIPMVLILTAEVIFMSAVFAESIFFKANLDLAAFAGILIAIGTGVDHLIVITDEVLKGEVEYGGWKKRIKNALFIVMGAYLTNVVAMIPLFVAGAGILRGFALITVIGMSFGVLVARPAYAVIIEKLLN